jgi:peptide deformylase
MNPDMPNILQRDDPVLRGKAKPVPISDIGSPKLNKILEDMEIAMSSQKDGIAIAAPQIGHALQMFMISGTLLKKADGKYSEESEYMIFINPKITKLSKEKKDMEEGCLSVRWLYGKVPRSTRASITALDEKGEKISRGASGLLAQIFQHECDHLNGVLFTDKADEVWEMSEDEIAELKK